MTPQDIDFAQATFIARLRRHRERNQIPLQDIAAQLRLKTEWLEAFERNDLSEWPRGLYARAWIRGYASAIGVDPIDTVDEFCRLFAHGDRRQAQTVREVAAIVAHPSEYREEIAPALERRRNALPVASPPPAWHVTFVRWTYPLWARLGALTSRRADPGSARRATP